MTIRMDEGAAELLYTLHRAGYAAYVVGGCVRDSLLGLTPHDWDLCTSALPQQVMELFGVQRCIPTGLQHGTVTVKQSGALYEITTFRTEGTYTDGRHPDEVHFVPDVRQDLARRDFTINAMAYNEKEGLVDPFGGQADLQSGIVRAVGVPRQRFTEDALRILRLYRFAARFGFAIDPPTAQAAQAWKKQGSTSFFKGCLVVLASVILLFLGIALQHWCTTAPLVFPHLAKNAEAYFEAQGRALSFSYEAGHVRGGYMASLLYDYNSETYYIGLFERDSLFHSRWRCCGGVVGFEAGQMTSYNYSDPEGNAIELEAEEFFARAVCHELDHLDGVLYVDKMDREILEGDEEYEPVDGDEEEDGE